MPNWAAGEMKIKAKNKKDIIEFIKYLYPRDNKEDKYFARAFMPWDSFADAKKNVDEYTIKEDNAYSYVFSFECAWSAAVCFTDAAYSKDSITGETNNRIVGLPEVCKKHKIFAELFCEELGMGFQEHYLIDDNGDFIIDDVVDWEETWEDEAGEELDEPRETGGFGEWRFTI